MLVWALIGPGGRVLADTEFKDENDAWWVGLCFPDAEGIANAKRLGYRVERVEVSIRPAPIPRPRPRPPGVGS
jgi:hypothetical protein